MTETVKEYPFCGSGRTEAKDNGWHWVRCKHCNTNGPTRINEPNAIQAWWNAASIRAETLQKERDDARELVQKFCHQGGQQIMTEDVEIRACPFCESTDSSVNSSHRSRWVLCFSCMASGPARNTEQEAVDAWNAASTRVKTLRKERDEARWFAQKFYRRGDNK